MSATLACGERRLGLGVVVQMDTIEFPADVVRATAVEGPPFGCLGLRARRTAANAAVMHEGLGVEELPLPVQRIQTDRGCEYSGRAFQLTVCRTRVEFRPIEPRSP